jgi:N utilization substance protein B
MAATSAASAADDVSARSKSRKRALDVLYAADVRGVDPDVALAELVAERAEARDSINPYTIELVEGVQAHQTRIDELLLTHAEGWAPDRMPVVDRTLLRMGIFEILWGHEVPDAVAVSEAVALATEISTDDSPRYINGLLGRILQLKPMLPEGRAASVHESVDGHEA